MLVQAHRSFQEGEAGEKIEKRPNCYVILAEGGTQTLKVGDHFYARFDQGLKEEEIRIKQGNTSKICVFASDTDLSRAEELLKNYCGESELKEMA